MYGNGLKLPLIRMQQILSRGAIFSFVVEAVGGMKIKTVESHVAMHLTAQKKTSGLGLRIVIRENILGDTASGK